MLPPTPQSREKRRVIATRSAVKRRLPPADERSEKSKFILLHLQRLVQTDALRSLPKRVRLLNMIIFLRKSRKEIIRI